MAQKSKKRRGFICYLASSDSIQSSSSPHIGLLQAFLQEFSDEFENYASVDGSLKRIYALPGERLAVACFREKGTAKLLVDGKTLLAREKQLLSHLQDLGLPTVPIYGEPFVINNRYAILMDWIKDASFIDVKDQESAARKLISAILDLPIPAGEGWVLQKNAIERKVCEIISGVDFSLDKFTQRARMLLVKFQHINRILQDTDHLINDLQLLINQEGVYIIDPMDVVKKVARVNSPNMCDYKSVLDDSKQENPDFIKVLYDGKRMLQQCISYCESLAMAESKDACQKIVLSLLAPKESVSPRGSSLQYSLLQGQKGVRQSVLCSIVKSSKMHTTRSSSSLKRPGAVATSSLDSPQSTANKSPKNSPHSSPQSSPEKKSYAKKDENQQVGSPESPTKVLCLDFKRLTAQSARKRLFLEETPIVSEVAVAEPSSSSAATREKFTN